MRTQGLCLLLLVQVAAGCSSPSSPSPPPVPASQPQPQPAFTILEPNVGSIGGHAAVMIRGTGFRPPVVVSFDGVDVYGRFDSRDPSTVYLETPSHAAGAVDVTVRNVGGYSHTVPAAYTYVLPDTFDFNGNWVGEADDGSHRFVRFTIENSQLVAAACDAIGRTSITPVPPTPVDHGEFMFVGGERLSITGRIVARREAVGTIDVPECPRLSWRAWAP